MPSSPEQAQRAAAFFRQASLERLLSALRQKYLQLGQVGGQVQLEEATAAERRELASFLGRPPSQERTLRVRLATVDAALRQSGFQCSLPELLAAAFPEQPLITRPEQRAAHASQQERFLQELQALAEDLAPDAPGRKWLFEGGHGLDWLFARHKNASVREQERQLELVRAVATLLNQLPRPSAPERLGLFAQRTSGDPHSLDLTRPLGRLFLQALSDLFDTRTPSSSRQSRVQEVQWYQQAGLLVDTISSSVAVFHLKDAQLEDGSSDPLPAAAGARILLLPLCQVQQWRSLSAASAAIYVLENPQVFETVVASLQTEPTTTTKPPTLVCTAGWPSVAALLLLDLLLSSDPARQLYYSGDFDLKGLQIASYLQERYPGRCALWQLDPSAYKVALGADGVAASATELALLETLPAPFSELVAQMQKEGRWAYQEGITDLLIKDAELVISPSSRHR